MHEDFERCLRAVQSKDARFDGWFVTAVRSTKIYCRPSCPARPPLAKNVQFYPSAAAAQQAGFRACKRCRPDASPGSPEWDNRSDVVSRAMRLIADGIVDREGVPGVARRLGYSTRQLERLLVAEVGAGPLALARSQRAQTARSLIETTDLPQVDVAFAAGFTSVRQFNATIAEIFGETPTAMRARAAHRSAARAPEGPGPSTPGIIALRLPFRRPLEPSNLFGHLVATAIPGCEEYRHGAYRRSLRLPHGVGVVALQPADGYIACRLSLSDGRDLHAAISRCRRLLDLDADPVAVVEVLGEDPHLGEAVRKAPGRRIPRCVDEAELAIRVVLGQQVSTAAARTLGARLARAGEAVVDAGGGLSRAWPTLDELADTDLGRIGLTGARQRCLRHLIDALAAGDIELGPGTDWERARRQLQALPGIGPWTAEMIALRGLGDPDAFPVHDLGLKAAAHSLGLPTSVTALTSYARRWQPWRGYATQYLWAQLPHPINDIPMEVSA
jgi:AraC family transcriptional regulator of adaptative response / DNA-3-methyladenine glycosylase II